MNGSLIWRSDLGQAKENKLLAWPNLKASSGQANSGRRFSAQDG
jgi:hypothetical protein